MLDCPSIALTTCTHARVHHLLASHASCLQWDDQGRYPCLSWAAGSYSSRAIVGEDGIGNPLLGAVDDVPIAFALCSGCDSCYIRSSCKCHLRLATGELPSELAITDRLDLSLQDRIGGFHPRSLVKIELSVPRCQNSPAAVRRLSSRKSSPK